MQAVIEQQLTDQQVKEVFGKKAQRIKVVVAGVSSFEVITTFGTPKGFGFDDRGYEYLYQPNGDCKRWVRKGERKRFRAAIAELKKNLIRQGTKLQQGTKVVPVAKDTRDGVLWNNGYIYEDKPKSSKSSSKSKSAVKEASKIPDQQKKSAKKVCQLSPDELNKVFKKLYELSREEFGEKYWDEDRRRDANQWAENLSDQKRSEVERLECKIKDLGYEILCTHRRIKGEGIVEEYHLKENSSFDDWEETDEEEAAKLFSRYEEAQEKLWNQTEGLDDYVEETEPFLGLSEDAAYFLSLRDYDRGTEYAYEMYDRFDEYGKQIFTLTQDLVDQWIADEKIIIPEGFPGYGVDKKTGKKTLFLPWYKDKIGSTEFVCFLQQDYRFRWVGLTLRPLRIDLGSAKYKPLGGLNDTASSNLACYENETPMQLFVPGDLKEWQEKSREWKSLDSYTFLIEGIAKPIFAGAIHQIKTIGCMGHAFHSRPEQLKKLIAQARQLTPGAFELVFPVDAGAATNEDIGGELHKLKFGQSFLEKTQKKDKDGNVLETNYDLITNKGKVGSLAKTIHLIREWQKDEDLKWGEFPIKILWYGQVEKPRITADARLKGDLDEIKSKLRDLLKQGQAQKYLLEYEDWAKTAQKNQLVKRIREESQRNYDNSYIASECKKNGWAIEELDTPDLKKKISYRLIKPGTITAIKSPMGSNKTGLFEDTLYSHWDRAKHYMPTIMKVWQQSIDLGLEKDSEYNHLKNNLNSDAFALWLQLQPRVKPRGKDELIEAWEESKKKEINDKQEMFDRFVEGRDGSPFYVIQTLNSLAIQSAARLKVAHREELKKIRGEYGFNAPKKSRHMSLCINSILDITIENAAGATILFDEFESIMDVLFTGSTCKDKREILLNHLRLLINAVTNTGGRIVLMDANLSLETLNQFTQLLFEAPLAESKVKKRLILNNYTNADSWNAKIFLGSSTCKGKVKKDDPSELIFDFYNKVTKDKKKAFFASDNKLLCQSLHYLLAKQGYKGLLITGDDKDEDAKAFLKDPNKYLKEHPDIQYTIVSPSVESGVSIQEPFFDFVFGCFWGVSVASNQIQMLGRVRPKVDRFIWVNVRGIVGAPSAENIELGHLTKFFTKEGVLAASKGSFHHSLQKVFKHLNHNKPANTRAWEHVNYLYGLEQDEFDDDIWFLPTESRKDLWESESLLNRIAAERTSTRLKQSYNLREELISRLGKVAKNITFNDRLLMGSCLYELEKFQQELQTAKEEVEKFKAKKTSESRDLTDEEARVRLESDGLTPDEQYELKKWLFKNATNRKVDCTPEAALMFMIQKNGRRLKQAQTLAIAENIEAEEKILARDVFFTGQKAQEGIAYLDQKRAIGSLLVSCGLTSLINKELSWSRDSFNDFFLDLIHNSSEVKQSFDKLNISTYRLEKGEFQAGLVIAKKLVEIVGMKFKLNPKTKTICLDDSDTRGNETWRNTYEGIKSKLQKDAEESLIKIREKVVKIDKGYADELTELGEDQKATEIRRSALEREEELKKHKEKQVA